MERAAMSDIEGSEPGWRSAARVQRRTVGNNPVSNQEQSYSFLSCSLVSLARDKLQDATAIQRRRFVAAPRHVGKDYWQVERHRKNHGCASPFPKNHGIKKRPPGCTWMNATVHDLVSPREQ